MRTSPWSHPSTISLLAEDPAVSHAFPRTALHLMTRGRRQSTTSSMRDIHPLRGAFRLVSHNRTAGGLPLRNYLKTISCDVELPFDRLRANVRAEPVEAPFVEIEIVCSDELEHRRRVETRMADIAGHILPTWQEVCEREYEPWQAGVAIDTAGQGIEASVSELREKLEGLNPTRSASREANA